MVDTTAKKGMAVPLTAFAVGAVVALLVGVFGRVHEPTLDGTTTLGYPTVLAMKTVVSTVIGVLVVVQLVGALWMYGKLGVRAPSWVGTAHRATGALAVLLSLFVAYHCLWSLGLEVGTLPNGEPVSTRSFVHGLVGCAVVGAIVVKITAVRARRAPGWFLPVAGGLLFSLLVVAVLTSVVWYIGDRGWPSRAG
ncbi:DUF6529 family protein [Geodermatophilus sp. YIM 151500]|uniref:DUF6529 family protein n=1 Tax=Geodermatophilus sp. YIM 151500 TaxID=2984531 RepID=UPI0021E4A763|nr:DUF6529 family protein [Geodermatophilus sp. YIM 151500]MCV2490831.1 DUF6529 family protein [Geodermatophilus sp. YIM 151500]